MYIRRIQNILFSASMCFTTGVFGASTQSLWTVLNEAKAENAAIHAQDKTRQASLDGYLSILAQLFPQLSASAGLSEHQYNANVSGHYQQKTYAVSLTQVLFNSALWMNMLSQYQTAESAGALYRYQYQQFLQLVVSRYFGVLEAEDVLNVDKANVQNLKLAYDQALAQYKVGMLVVSAVKQAEAEYRQALATQVADQAALASAKAALKALINLPVKDLAPLKEGLHFEFPSPENLSTWIANGQIKNQNLKAAQASMEAEKLAYASDVGAWVPSVSLKLSVTNTNTLQGSDQALVSPLGLSHTIDRKAELDFAWNLFGGSTGANPYSIAQGAALYEAAQESSIQTGRDVRALISQDFNRVQADLQGIEKYQAAVDASEAALVQYQARFKVGLSTMLDVLQSVDAFYQAKSEYLQSQYQFINDEIQLKLDAGTLSDQDLQELNQRLRYRPLK